MKRNSKVMDESIDGYDWYEGQPKWRATRVIGVIFGVISVLVWGIILFRIFSAQNKTYENMILLNDTAAALYPEPIAKVTRLVPNTENQLDPAVMIYTPTALPEAENMQVSVRIRTKLFTAPSPELPAGYRFVLRERGEQTQEYALSYFQSETRFGYAFYRIAFEGVRFSDEKEYLLLIYPADSSATPLFSYTLYNADAYAHQTTPSKSAFVRVETP